MPTDTNRWKVVLKYRLDARGEVEYYPNEDLLPIVEEGPHHDHSY